MSNIEQRRIARQFAFATHKNVPVEIVPGLQFPEETGQSFHWTTPGGRPVYHPNAYRRAWGKPVYNNSTLCVTVGTLFFPIYSAVCRVQWWLNSELDFARQNGDWEKVESLSELESIIQISSKTWDSQFSQLKQYRSIYKNRCGKPLNDSINALLQLWMKSTVLSQIETIEAPNRLREALKSAVVETAKAA